MKLLAQILSKEKSNYQDIDHRCPSYGICSGMYPRCLYTPLYLCSYADPLCIRRYLNYNVFALEIKPRANGHNIVGQQLPTLLDVTCCVRLHVVACCWE